MRRRTAVILGLVALLLASLAGAAQAGPKPDIVGGGDASTQDYPWVVSLRINGQHFCGGTFISNQQVLTTAHCLAWLDDPTRIEVVAGRDARTGDGGDVYPVESYWMQPDYDPEYYRNDIAMLMLPEPVPYPWIDIVEDGETQPYQAGNVGTILGWGDTAEDGDLAETLQQAEVPLMSDEDCASAYAEPYITTVFCAGYAEGGIDSCQGDSGGPIVVDGRLAGVITFGRGCAREGSPGAYTKLSLFAAELHQV
ncbi:S1 family peptidase [Amycolatopsis sp. NPDC059657]|uniref:S1 family peptidase n=1 Tax=Amycolatopsis sp. NPDC059657 TaxID=3346899 RepID=UPI00366BF7C5